MKTLSNILKTAAVAGVMGLGLSTVATTSADARSFTRCGEFGCYRVYCNDRGYCRRTRADYYRSSSYYYGPRNGYYDRDYYRTVRVCDEWGCHTVRRSEPRARIGIGLRF